MKFYKFLSKKSSSFNIHSAKENAVNGRCCLEATNEEWWVYKKGEDGRDIR